MFSALMVQLGSLPTACKACKRESGAWSPATLTQPGIKPWHAPHMTHRQGETQTRKAAHQLRHMAFTRQLPVNKDVSTL